MILNTLQGQLGGQQYCLCFACLFQSSEIHRFAVLEVHDSSVESESSDDNSDFWAELYFAVVEFIALLLRS